jgi:CubicO group peptidase (beta-lactamase class C family)
MTCNRLFAVVSVHLSLVLMLLPPAELTAQVRPAPAEISAAVDEIFKRWDSPEAPGCAVGVGRAGSPILARAYGMADLEHEVPNRAETVFEAGSVSKQFTTAAVFLLAETGRLSLDDDVRRHLPEIPDYGTPITIRHLIHHTSGLRDWGTVVSAAGWPRTRRAHTNAHALDVISRQRSLNYTPGAEYSYTNSGYNLMAIIVERVSGRSFAEFTRDELFEPLGMRRTEWRDDGTRIVKGRATAYSAGREGFRTLMPFEDVHGNGGLLTTVGDLLIWNENLETGKIGGPALVEEMHRRGRLNDGRLLTYAGGLMVDSYRGFHEVSHSGSTAGYQAFLTRFPEEKLSVAVLCNVTDTNPGALARRTADLFLPAHPKGAAPTSTAASPRAVQLPAEMLARIAGLYRNLRTGEPLRVTLDDGTLRLAGRTELIPLSDSIFQMGSGAARVAIEWAGGGRVGALRQIAADGDVVLHEPVAEFHPTPAALAGFQGEYWSDEAEAGYTVALEGERLVLKRRPGVTIPITPTYVDAFMAANGWLVRFQRDQSGQVTAMSFGMGRVRELIFQKTTPTAAR